MRGPALQSDHDTATEITDFASLLSMAGAQPEPQRLLFVFVKVVLPEDHDEAEAERYREGRGGALLPVMHVDKDVPDLNDFDQLVTESQQMGEDWHMVLVAAMPGENGQPPSATQSDEALDAMVKTIHAGGDLSRYLAFDRQGNPVQFV